MKTPKAKPTATPSIPNTLPLKYKLEEPEGTDNENEGIENSHKPDTKRARSARFGLGQALAGLASRVVAKLHVVLTPETLLHLPYRSGADGNSVQDAQTGSQEPMYANDLPADQYSLAGFTAYNQTESISAPVGLPDPWAAEISTNNIAKVANADAWLSDAELVPAAVGGRHYMNLGTDFLTAKMEDHRCSSLRGTLSRYVESAQAHGL